MWIAPGGHIDKGELIKQAVAREMGEEIGVEILPDEVPEPFLVTVTDIDNRPKQTCRRHYDLWHLIETDGSNFRIDPREFHEVRWLTVGEARDLVVDPSNILALDYLEHLAH